MYNTSGAQLSIIYQSAVPNVSRPVVDLILISGVDEKTYLLKYMNFIYWKSRLFRTFLYKIFKTKNNVLRNRQTILETVFNFCKVNKRRVPKECPSGDEVDGALRPGFIRDPFESRCRYVCS